jgi:oxygen tolerance protein BatD
MNKEQGTRNKGWGIALLCGFVLVLCGGDVSAQQRAEVIASASAETVEVGEPFTVTMRATVQGDDEPQSPAFHPPSGFSLSNPSVSRFSLGVRGFGGSMNQRILTVTWQLVASQTGTFTLPSPTVNVAGEDIRAAGVIKVQVVGAGQRPPGAGPAPPLGRLLGPGFGADLDDLLDDEPDPIDPRAQELSLPREPDPYVFVRLVPDKKKAYVGEQVTVIYYVYSRIETPRVEQREPQFGDFVRMELDAAPGTDDALITTVGARRYSVKPLDRVAIFPLRAGKLKTGRLSCRFETARFGGSPIERESNDLEIEVIEPPTDGRPPGYQLGTVGRYKIAAEVRPREIKAGESVVVMLRVNGIGQLPTDLNLPARVGVEWLDPVKKDELAIKAGRIGGWRTFAYAVRIKTPGMVDLGTVELPFWDLERGRYDVARAELGSILVQQNDAAPAASADTKSAEDPFTTLPQPRATPQSYDGPGAEGLEPRMFWALVVVPPVGVLLAGFAQRGFSVVRRRRRERAGDPGALANRALADMRSAADAKDQAAAAERALHLAIEAATGLKSRAILLASLAAALRDKRVRDTLADEVVSVLERCASIRFEPEPDAAAFDEVRERARAAVKDLLRLRNDNGTA